MRKPRRYKYHIVSCKTKLGLPYIETEVEL